MCIMLGKYDHDDFLIVFTQSGLNNAFGVVVVLQDTFIFRVAILWFKYEVIGSLYNTM
uniref:Uncharacterized protein n=1 Tax=Anguilla anguilla TaxID=7936 RepID=A0A0E9XNW6_ANGAN